MIEYYNKLEKVTICCAIGLVAFIILAAIFSSIQTAKTTETETVTETAAVTDTEETTNNTKVIYVYIDGLGQCEVINNKLFCNGQYIDFSNYYTEGIK